MHGISTVPVPVGTKSNLEMFTTCHIHISCCSCNTHMKMAAWSYACAVLSKCLKLSMSGRQKGAGGGEPREPQLMRVI
jgi:hypothetical protein